MLADVEQPPGVVKVDGVVDLAPLTIYNLLATPRTVKGLNLHVFGLRIGAIDIEIGESVQIQPPIPALRISLEVFGSAKAEFKGLGLANVQLRDNKLRIEFGLRLRPDGSISLEHWIDVGALDIDLANDAILAAIGLGGFIGLTTVLQASEVLELLFTEYMRLFFQAFFNSADAALPDIFADLLGEHFTFKSVRVEGADIVFDYGAPLEPDPRPQPANEYLPAMGRAIREVTDLAIVFRPALLGDTWAAGNLSEINHIVVVMMENRSFDHVLGYIAATAPAVGSNGLSGPLTTFLKEQGHRVRAYRDSGIAENGVDLRTRFPVDVGHSLEDVAQQLSKQLDMPAVGGINSPEGFKENFAKRRTDPLLLDDVLGFYDAQDLPFFKYLTDNYAWSESFFCSHPGPTLPNRMYSIAGDVQHDRTGEAILNNNRGANRALSRAATIFDLLTRKGVSWRIYESFPSVTMLRMFARYATDTTNIVNISDTSEVGPAQVGSVARLEQDIADDNLPAVTFIDPAMADRARSDRHRASLHPPNARRQ